MNLHERFAELREEERKAVPAFSVALPWRLQWLRPAATFAILVLLVLLAMRPHHVRFTPDDRAAARAIAEWRPQTDFLLRMPSTGVSR